MSQAGRWPITIRKGEDFSLEFWVEIDDVVLDLTGASVYGQIRKLRNRETDLILDFTVTVDGVAVTNPAPTDNVIKLTLTDVQTAAIDDDETSGYYDVLVVGSGGEDIYYLEGPVTILDSVTVKP